MMWRALCVGRLLLCVVMSAVADFRQAWPAIAVGLFVAFGGVLFGYDTSTISGILAMP